MNTATTTGNTRAPAAAGAWKIPAELNLLIDRMARHQTALGLSDERFVRRFKWALTSTDTWVRTLRQRDPARLTRNNAAKWTETLRKLSAHIDGAPVAATVYELPMLRAAVALHDRLQGATDDRRVAWIVGAPGTGKTWSLGHLRRAHPADTAWLVAAHEMNGNRRQIAREFARALGTAEKATAADTMDQVCESLRARPVTVLVDEFHEGGVLLFRTIKNLVNKCPAARFILATLPTAYDRMLAGRGNEYEETLQLRRRSVGLIRKQWAGGLRAEDAAAYLAAACPEIPADELPALAARLLPLCGTAALALLADAAQAAHAAADTAGVPLNASHLCAAAARLGNDF
jgi:hypothetical protein